MPIRLADFGVLHRNESSGSLSGLTRVRRFQQDDAHIFCKYEDIERELTNQLTFLGKVYNLFEFTYTVNISTRPKEFLGSEEKWDDAEKILEMIVKNANIPYKINKEDGAFYGPKIDITIKDSLNREHQVGTFQLDFTLPERFDLKYLDVEGDFKRPVIIHRAIFGSFERFIAILLEHTQGKLPFVFSPRQISIISLYPETNDYAGNLYQTFKNKGYEIIFDDSDDHFKNKIKDAELVKTNFIIVIGRKEMEENTMSVREKGKSVKMTLDHFLENNRPTA